MNRLSFFLSVSVSVRFLIAQRPLTVMQALGRGVHHDAENHQNSEQRVDYSQQFVLQVSEIQFYSENTAHGLHQKQQRGDQGNSEHFTLSRVIVL